ncbi:MAG TPA: D-alanyl-D-alanine carboxypeptidase/D-alanyl-D-alanine-endopeptidase [Chitinophagaceae bacterium]|nr:D-alanyl-D-alanine carboxypeptidase/D-alanyl-D-alanine-endopeptidase [Chitinophagaceae bacterium]
MKKILFSILSIASVILLASCSSPKGLSSAASKYLIADTALKNAHTGIAVFDPESGKFLYEYQDDKYFVPASNTKIMSCYAAMKTLGDQLQGISYVDMDTALVLIPTGDPTFLHKDYKDQPVADFIRNSKKKIYIDASAWSDQALGFGWSWDDYSEYYMAERSALPVYGNVVRWYQVKSKKENPANAADTIDTFIYSDPELDGPVDFGKPENGFRVERKRDSNAFTIYEGKEKNAETDVPYVTDGVNTGIKLLNDSLHKEIFTIEAGKKIRYTTKPSVIFSRPVDSMLKPMMHRSDNFFAEQALLMSGYSITGVMNSGVAVQAITKQLLTGMPDKAKWVDGSGLSRYNLFTPRDFVWVLDKMKKEISWERITTVFPTGGRGTLRTYSADSGRLYAKTGTLSGVIALSGYVITKKNKTLIFSILINNHQQPTAVLRSKMAAFLGEIIENY